MTFGNFISLSLESTLDSDVRLETARTTFGMGRIVAPIVLYCSRISEPPMKRLSGAHKIKLHVWKFQNDVRKFTQLLQEKPTNMYV